VARAFLEAGDDMDGYDIMDLASFLEYVEWLPPQSLFAQSAKVAHPVHSLPGSFAQVGSWSSHCTLLT